MCKTYAILSAIFAALTAVLAKAGLKNINADVATAVRTSFVLVIVWSIVLFNGKTRELQNFQTAHWIYLLLSAIATGLSWLFYFRALQTGDTASVNAIDKSSLVLVLLLSMVFLNEALSIKTLVGIGLILAGTLVLTWK